MTLYLLIGIFVLLALLGLPLAVASGLAALFAFTITGQFPLLLVYQKMLASVDGFALLAIPMFVLCGRLMNTAGITDRIFHFANCLVGHITGGLALANVVASMIFAGMSGSAVSDAAGLGQVEIKAMKDQGYDTDFAAAVTAASSTIGPIIPPSVPMIIYASISEESIGRLFLGGIFPGFIASAAISVLIYSMSKRRNYPKSPRASCGHLWQSFKQAILSLLTPFIIFGGIAFGVFTVTEAAVVAALYAGILGMVIYRNISFRDLPGIMVETLKTTAVIMFILSTIAPLTWLLVMEGAADNLLNYVFSITKNPWVILGFINIFLIIAGTVLESLPVMLITVPLLVPLLEGVGVSLVHFGVVFTLNQMIGLVTPPIGMLLFVTSQISNLKLERMMKAILPFLIPLIITLIIITYIPETIMFLPDLLMP